MEVKPNARDCIIGSEIAISRAMEDEKVPENVFRALVAVKGILKGCRAELVRDGWLLKQRKEVI